MGWAEPVVHRSVSFSQLVWRRDTVAAVAPCPPLLLLVGGAGVRPVWSLPRCWPGRQAPLGPLQRMIDSSMLMPW